MVRIEEGGPAELVPLVYYDEMGKRHVVGDALVSLRQGRLSVNADYKDFPGATEIPGMNLEAFSIDAPSINGGDIHVASDLEPQELAERTLTAFQRYQRRGLSSGEEGAPSQKCPRKDLHGSHNWTSDVGVRWCRGESLNG